MVEAWRSGGVPLLDSTGLARVFITSLLLFAIAICLILMPSCELQPPTKRQKGDSVRCNSDS